METNPQHGDGRKGVGVVSCVERKLSSSPVSIFSRRASPWATCCVCPIILLGVLVHAPLALAEIFPYNNQTLEYGGLIYRESGMYAPGQFFLEPGADGGNDESFIKVSELKFTAKGDGCFADIAPVGDCILQEGHVELAIFEQKSFGDVGVIVDNSRYYCCDKAAQMAGACGTEKNGQLLLASKSDIKWHKRLSLVPEISNSLGSDDVFHVYEDGMYVVLLANCDGRTGTIHVNGHSEWMNPYGYIPGEMYGCLPFFFFLAVTYLMLGVVWMGLSMAYIKDLLPIQMWATVVLLLGMVETGAQYFDYRDWNLRGTRSEAVQSFSILFGAAKRALSLALVLMVCMGYGIVRQSLGREVHRIMALALVYFVASALLVALKNTPHEDKEFSNRASVDLATMLVFFNSLIVVAFYAWILQSIFGVIQHLRLRRQTLKLKLYYRFRAVFASSVLLGVAWAIYGIVQSSEAEEERRWKSYWTLDAIWELLYLGVLVAICFLLRPNNNNQRFAFSELPSSDGARDGDYGDILLQSMNDEEAEYGGCMDEDDDVKADAFLVPAVTEGGKDSHATAASAPPKNKVAP